MGTQYIIPAFLVVVAGGVGQIKGTVIAAWAMGIALSLFADWTTGDMAVVLAFVLVVVFLQFRPQGLFTVAPGIDMTKLKPWLPLIGIGVFAVLLLVVAPAVLSMHWINNLGEYCCSAIAAVGIGLAGVGEACSSWARGSSSDSAPMPWPIHLTLETAAPDSLPVFMILYDPSASHPAFWEPSQ